MNENAKANHKNRKLRPEEEQVARTIASGLFTVAAISLAIVGYRDDDFRVDRIFGAIGLLSIIGGAVLIDAIMDDLQIGFIARLRRMSGGYLFFALAISGMCFGIFYIALITAEQGVHDKLVELFYGYPVPFFLIAAATIFFKLMTKTDFELLTLGILVTFGYNFYIFTQALPFF